MVYYTDSQLSDIFSALADPTRRGMLARLRRGPATISELAAPFDISLPGASKHISVLVRARLVRQSRFGRHIQCELAHGNLKTAANYLATYEKFWS